MTTTDLNSKLDIKKIQLDFPILSREVRNNRKLIYLDSAATSQKPQIVIDAQNNFYETINSGVHRGAYYLAELATDAHEKAREIISGFIKIKPDQLIFTKNATESLNLLSYSFLNATMKAKNGVAMDKRLILNPGDEILVTELEHHANLVPWQELCLKTGAVLRWIPITDQGILDYNKLASLISNKTKVVSVSHMSNVLGSITDIETLSKAAKSVGAFFFIDACQSVPHMPVDFNKLGADAIAWSGHKMLGPLGIGLLGATEELLSIMPPFISGGSMIETVSMEKSTFSKAPRKFEAGTPPAAEAVGLGAAVEYLQKIGMENIHNHERHLTKLLLDGLKQIQGVTIYGPTDDRDRGSTVSFALDGLHPHDVGQVLDDMGIAVRVGNHCARPIMDKLKVQSTTRASTYIYNDDSDIKALIDGIEEVFRFFGRK
jgi:cysteine desulfurase / selenocysteine lyase